METAHVHLEMSTDLAVQVVPRAAVQQALRANPNITVQSIGQPSIDQLAHHDFGATILIIAGTAAGIAAIEGLFSLIRTVVEQASESSRQRRQHKHDIQMIRLKVNEQECTIDVSRPVAELRAVVAELQKTLNP